MKRNAFIVSVVTVVVCFVLWIFFFERVVKSDMPTWLKYMLLK